MVLIQRKLYFSKDPEGGGGGATYSRGSNFFSRGGGGLNANFYRNPYNL